MKGKTVAESATTMTELVLPNDANVHGTMLGGRVMHLMDMAGAAAAARHCRRRVVTASVDSLRFLYPVRVGQLIVLEAFVNRAFRTSMEVEVRVSAEDILTGERAKTSDAFFSFVAVDHEGRPVEVPPIVPESETEQRRFEAALQRRRRRLEERQQQGEARGEGGDAGPR